MTTSSGQRGPLPIIVGVTGHRDLRSEDVQPLTDAVRKVLAKLQAQCPHTGLLILSPLAEGADRLVARVALDLGMRIAAPLPLEPADYRKEFADAASVAEFDALVARADQSFVVRCSDGASSGPPESYARVGAYVARHCHVLLALWDGQPTHNVGGTAEIIRYRIEGMSPELAPVRPLECPDSGIAYHIVTPRRSNAQTEGTPFELRVLAPSHSESVAHARQLFDRMCRSTDAFNRFVLRAGQRVAAARATSRRDLLQGVTSLPAGTDALLDLFACADHAAGQFQKKTRATVRTLFWIAFGIVVSFELFAEGDDLVPQLPVRMKLMAYLALFAIGFGVQKWGTSREFDTRHLDYRALVEALRVQFYWAAAQVRAVVADYWLRERLEGTEWIRTALRGCEVSLPMPASAPSAWGSSGPRLTGVVDDWVKGQRDYFARVTAREERLLHRLERRTNILFAISLIGVALIFVQTFDLVPALPEVLHSPLVALIGLSGAAAALIHGYSEQRALSLHVRRYDRMHALFAAGLRALERPMAAGDWPAAQDLLVELGREALDENSDWMMLHRERPMELPM